MSIRRALSAALSIGVFVIFTSYNVIAQVSDNATVVPRIVHYSGKVDTTTLPTQSFPQTLTLIFSIYPAEDSPTPIFTETHLVTIDDATGRYTASLGSQTASGMPFDPFVTASASWIGVSVNSGNELPRTKLTSAAYAMKAGDADTLGGKPASAYLTTSVAGQIPNSSTTATDQNVPGAIVARDSQGNFAAMNIGAAGFFGNGYGLRNIPNEGTTATDQNVGGAIVSRDYSGNFAANIIFGRFFVGDGSNLTNLIAANSAHATVADLAASATSADTLAGTPAANFVRTDQRPQFAVGANFYGGAPYSVPLMVNQIDTGKTLMIGIQGDVTDNTRAQNEVFNLDSSGNQVLAGAAATYFPGSATEFNYPVRLVAGNLQGVHPGDNDAIGITIGSSTFKTEVAYAGVAGCRFSAPPTAGHYVIVGADGNCADAGASAPAGVQVIGIALASGIGQVNPVFLGSGIRPVTPNSGGTLTAVTAGAGLTGGTITSTGTIAIANSAVTNSMLQNSGITVVPGTGLSGGGSVTLGSSFTLTNTGAISFAGRSGAITPAAGDYSFAQLSGTATAAQLPANVVFGNQANTFGANQTVNGAVSATSFVGDGSQLTNVNAVSLGGVSGSSFATAASVTTESTARQSADTALQSNIDAETTARQTAITSLQTVASSEVSARQSADSSLQANLNAETSVRQSADASLQSSIDTVISTSAKLTASNTFSAKQNFPAATTSAASISIASGTAPSTPTSGDLWNSGGTLQYRDSASATRSIVTSPSPTGMQMVKFTASITPTSVAATICAEQSFAFTGVVGGDIVLAVSQPTTSGPGTNIAIGGARVTANNTLIVQFCNVGKSGGTPTAGTYTAIVIR